MLRITALAGALLCLIFTVSAEARPRQVICNNTDVMRPCGPVFGRSDHVGDVNDMIRSGRREAKRIARGQRLEQSMPFGAAIVPPETQRSFLSRGAEILGGRPAGCPHRFCGCGVSLKVFGRIIPDLNLAANWKRFASAMPGAGTVAWRPGHVLYVEASVGGNLYQVYDPNSGGGKIRRHVRNLARYNFVDPHSPRQRMAGL